MVVDVGAQRESPQERRPSQTWEQERFPGGRNVSVGERSLCKEGREGATETKRLGSAGPRMPRAWS